MLRTLLMSASALALMAGATVAQAADLNVYDPAPSPAPYSHTPAAGGDWTGPYVGVTGGYGWGENNVDGLVGGAFAGYNFQMSPSTVVGVEGDLTAHGGSGSVGGSTVSNPWNGTLRGRLGYTSGSYMLYGTGGVAVGGVKAVTGSTTENATNVGYTLGVGVEAKLTERAIGRAEVRHTDLGTESFSTAPTVSTSSTDLMFGLGMGF